jgi:hypothetical protein
MKRSIGFLILGVLLSFSLVHAQQPQFVNCAVWTGTLSGGDGVTAKNFYLAGFSDGLGTGVAAALNPATEQRRKEVLKSVWLVGVSAAQMRVLIDEYCGRPQNKGLSIIESVVNITREIEDQRSR